MPLHVMIDAQAARIVFLATMAGAMAQALLSMQQSMCSVRCQQFQIVHSIIGTNAIEMMDDFAAHQGATNPLRHQIAMLKHVAVHIGHRVVTAYPHLNITRVMAAFAASPVFAIWSCVVRTVVLCIAPAITELRNRRRCFTALRARLHLTIISLSLPLGKRTT